MTVRIENGRAVFAEGDAVAGICVLDDPFKPYVCPLNTPDGHNITRAMPADHRHHKGLMYALRCPDLNFWEEPVGEPDCGAQRVLAAEASGDGLELDLLWEREGGGMETYRERRVLRCRGVPERRAFLWTWESRREALRDHRLVKSPASRPDEGGRLINYHGLGFRAPRVWAFPKPWALEVEMDGRPARPAEVHGAAAREVLLRGRLDGHWTPPVAAITIRQEQAHTWFLLGAPFAYLSAGPSNLEEVEVAAGSVFQDRYEIEVADCEVDQ